MWLVLWERGFATWGMERREFYVKNGYLLRRLRKETWDNGEWVREPDTLKITVVHLL
jgi:hypothetical protein